MKNVVPRDKGGPKTGAQSAQANPLVVSDKFFDVILSGEVVPGQDPTAVAHRLAKLLRLPFEEARKLIAGRAITLKSNTPTVVALRYMNALNGVGAVARIIPVTAGQTDKPSAPPSANKSPPKRRADAASQPEPEQTDNEPLSDLLLRKKLDFRLIPATVEARETFRLLLVAGGVLALPAVYLALIAAVGMSIVWHAGAHLDWVIGDSSLFLWIPYFTPIVLGVVSTALLIKPLVAPIAPAAPAMKFSPEREPLLFAFVEAIAHAVSAPVPEEISYSWQSSLVADADDGVLASFRRRVRLVIGLPVLGSLTMTQLASLIAMELARFSNRPRYRLVYVIDAVHLMLYHGAFEDDYWDTCLEKAIRNRSGLTALALVALQGLIRFGRLPMLALNRLCETISSDTLVQFRLNSDRYAAALAGPRETRIALTRVEALIAAQPLVVDEIFHRWQNGQRTAAIPQVIIEQANNLPANVLNTIRSNALVRSRGPLGIYPSLKRRFNALSVLPQRSLADLHGPARELVAAFESLCAVATQDYFEAMALFHGRENGFIAAGHSNAQREDRQTMVLKHYFRGLFHPDRFLVPEPRDNLSVFSGAALMKELGQLQAEIDSRLTDYSNTLAKYENLRSGKPRNLAIYSATSASGVFRTARDHRAVNTHNAHTGRVSEEQLEQSLWRFESLIEDKMGIALAVAMKYGNPALRGKVESLLRTQRLLARAKPMIDSLLHFANTIQHRLHEPRGTAAADAASIRRYLERCRDAYFSLLGFLSQGVFPFQGGNNPNYIVEYFQHSAGHPNDMMKDPELCIANTHAVMQNLQSLHRTVMAELAEIAAVGEQELTQQASVRRQPPPDIDPQLAGVF